MVKKLLLAAFAAVSSCTASGPAYAAPSFPDRGRAGVVDAAAVLPEPAERALNDRVVAWDRKTGHQLVVATVPSLQGVDVKDYGYQLGRTWGLGDAKRNDGVILLLAPNERKVRIEVGYGLEPVLTDALTSVIVRQTIVPKLKAGDTAGALADGADAIMAAASARTPLPETGERNTTAAVFWWGLLLLSAGGVIGLVLLLRRRRKARREAEAALAAATLARERRRARSAARTGEATTTSLRDPQDNRSWWLADHPAEQVERTHLGDRLGGTIPRYVAPAPASAPSATPVYVAPIYEAPRRRDDDIPSSSYSPSDWGSSSSPSDSSTSSSGFDSGGGSFGGGGSDSSY